MKIKSNTFTPCPEYTGRGVIVGCTELKLEKSEFGDKEKFRFVIEVGLNMDNGHPYTVYSPSFVPSTGEKASLTKFLKCVLGIDEGGIDLKGDHKFLADEDGDLNTDNLAGHPVHLEVVHVQSKDKKSIFANIAEWKQMGTRIGWKIGPHRDSDGEPMKPSGHWKPKVSNSDDSSGQHTGGSGAASEEKDPLDIKVHVGNHEKKHFTTIPPDAVVKLHDKWIPRLEGHKLTADDKRLVKALELSIDECVQAELERLGEEQFKATHPVSWDRMQAAAKKEEGSDGDDPY